MAFSRVTFLAAAVGAAVVVGLGALGAFSTLEDQTIDWRYRHARSNAEPMSDRIALVAIDDKANDYARWPWSRGDMAAAFREIALCGPKVIALDVFQSNPERGTDGDARLAAVIEEARAAGTQFVLAAEIGGAAEESAAVGRAIRRRRWRSCVAWPRRPISPPSRMGGRASRASIVPSCRRGSRAPRHRCAP
jgi:CHASE2 domain-containing sensor protein